MMRPFWRYFGGKWRASGKLYPPPDPDLLIVEPFAGAAGYSTRHAHRQVILVEKDECVAGVWRYLINADPAEIEQLPLLDADHNPDADPRTFDIPVAAQHLIGFWLNTGTTHPGFKLTGRNRKWRTAGGKLRGGFTEDARARIAQQVPLIKEWRVVEGDYLAAPAVEATWFVDPPYVGMGYRYRCGSAGIDYMALGVFCLAQRGPIIVCEGPGADWLPFEKAGIIKGGAGHKRAGKSTEYVWMNSRAKQLRGDK
jgi:hypothetical protein